MARQRTGQLIHRRSGWYARVWSTIDGERVRVMRALGTHNKTVARRKLERLLAAENPVAEDVRRPETFAEAAERVYAARIAEAGTRPGRQREELASLHRVALPVIGSLAVTAIRPVEINQVLDAAKAAGLSKQSAQHVRQRMGNVFKELVREGVVSANPVRDAIMPKYPKVTKRHRAVLADSELAVYLGWEHSAERHRPAVRERQTMSVVSRMFGGLRTGDLHALRWESFDVNGGAFGWGYAPRAKTAQPQKLEVPEPLRPFLRDWWERAGRPTAGLVFPVRAIGKLGDRVGEARLGSSHAEAMRRDLQRAFTDARARGVTEAPAEGSKRWQELFHVTPESLPVDFHSWRRGFSQALRDAGVNAQQAMALAGHASPDAHARYLYAPNRAMALPPGALPDLRVLPAFPADTASASSAREVDHAKGSTAVLEGSDMTDTGQASHAIGDNRTEANATEAIRKPLLYPAELRVLEAAGIARTRTHAGGR